MDGTGNGRVVNLRELRRSCTDCSLRSLCLPAGIGSDAMESLDKIVQSRVPIEKGEFLFRAGSRFDHLYVVRTGSLQTVMHLPEGETQVVGFHLPSELVGIEGISDQRHHCDAIVLERTNLCAVRFADLEDIAARVPALQRQLHRLISNELTQDHRHLIAMGRHSARERVALFLVSLSERFANAGYDSTGFRLAMSRNQIASYLGLALETISRLLTSLDSEGVLDVDRRWIHIRDADELRRMVGQTPVAAAAGDRCASDCP